MPEDQLIEAYCSTLKPARAGDTTRRLHAFRMFLSARHVGLLQATKTDLLHFKQHLLATGKAEPTTDRRISIVRCFYAWCLSQGFIDINPAATIKGTTKPTRTPPTPDEIERLMRAAVAFITETRGNKLHHQLACRLHLIILLATEAGIRPIELSKLTLADFDPTTRSVLVGRGSASERTIPLSQTTFSSLLRYLRATGGRHVGDTGPLFHRIHRGKDTNIPLPGGKIVIGLRRLLRQAGLRPELTLVTLARNLVKEVGQEADLDVARAVSGRVTLKTVAVTPVSVSVAELRAALEQFHPLGRRTLADLRDSAPSK